MFGSWANRKAGCAKRSSFWSEQSIFRQTQRYNTETQHLEQEPTNKLDPILTKPETFSRADGELFFELI